MSDLRRYAGYLPLCSLILASIAMPCPARAQGKGQPEPDKPVVAIVAVNLPPAAASNRAAIESKLFDALESTGWVVVDRAETERRVGENKSLLACVGDVCGVQLARITKAQYLVWVDVVEEKRKHTINAKLFYFAKMNKPVTQRHGKCTAKELPRTMFIIGASTGGHARGIIEELAHPDPMPEGPRPLVAVVSLDVPPDFAGARDDIESSLARGLGLAGWDVLDVSATTAAAAGRQDLRECQGGACVSEMALLVHSRFVVWAAVSLGKNIDNAVSISLFDAENPGTPLARQDDECRNSHDDCRDAADHLYQAARELGRKGMNLVLPTLRQTPLTVAPAPTTRPLARRSPLPAPLPAPLIPPPNVEEEKPRSSAWGIAGWTAIGAGLALVGTGAVLLAYDGSATDCEETVAGKRCYNRYTGRTQGLAIGGVGLVSGLVGAYLVIFPGRAHSTSVALSPSGIYVGGGF